MLQRKQELLTEMAAREEGKRKYNQFREAGESSLGRGALRQALRYRLDPA